MIGWATGLIQYRVAEAERLQIQALHERVDDAHRVVLGDVFLQRLRKESHLVSISAWDIVHGKPLYSTARGERAIMASGVTFYTGSR
jgi:hypothetical protein